MSTPNLTTKIEDENENNNIKGDKNVMKTNKFSHFTTGPMLNPERTSQKTTANPFNFRLLEDEIEEEASISNLVKDSCVTLDYIYERGFGPEIWLKRRFLLLRYPKSDIYIHMYPPAPQALTSMFPHYFNLPYCDLGCSVLTPELRALLTYASSAAHGCEYTMAHGIHMKSLFRSTPAAKPKKLASMTFYDDKNNKNNQCHEAQFTMNVEKNNWKEHDDNGDNGDIDNDNDNDTDGAKKKWENQKRDGNVTFTKAEEAAINIALAMSAVPHRVTNSMRKDLTKHFGVQKEQEIVSVATITGYLNRLMGIIDVPIEYESFKYCQKYSHQIGWKPGKHFKIESLRHDIMEIDEEKRKTNNHKFHLIQKLSSSLTYPIQLIKNVKAIKKLEKTWLDKIPKKYMDMKEFLVDVIGFWPKYLGIMKNVDALRATIYAVTDILFTSGKEIPRYIKALMIYICALGAKNHVLIAQFAFIAFQFGATESQIAFCRQQHVLIQMYQNSEYSLIFQPNELVLLILAHACKNVPAQVEKFHVHLLDQNLEHCSIIEAITVVSIYGVLQRWTAVYTPHKFEPIVQRFVHSPSGRRLNLPLKPNPVVFQD